MGCSNTNQEEIEFILGTWQVEDKNQYEFWEKTGPFQYAGEGYIIEQGKKKVLETLEVAKMNNDWYY